MYQGLVRSFGYKARTLIKTQIVSLSAFLFGAADRGRTGTLFRARDFKSLVSAYSTTAAYLHSETKIFYHFEPLPSSPACRRGKITRNSGREWWGFVKLSNKCTEKRHMIVELCRNMRYNEGKNSGLCGYLKKERKMLNFLGRVQFIGQRMMYDESR